MKVLRRYFFVYSRTINEKVARNIVEIKASYSKVGEIYSKLHELTKGVLKNKTRLSSAICTFR